MNRKDVTKVLNLIETQIDRLLNMDYDDRYLEIAKMYYRDRIISGLDHAQSLIAQAFLDDLLHRQLMPEQRIERIMKVTKEDISRVALRLIWLQWPLLRRKKMNYNLDIKKETLSNGLQVILVHKPDYQKSLFLLGAKVGGFDIDQRVDGQVIRYKSGIAHYLEHQMFY